MNKPLVSVIIPVYNIEKEMLVDCFNSVSDQSYESVEVIVVDDGSRADTARLCREHVDKHRNFSLITKNNEGVNYARRDGLSASSGEYIVFVDSDDMVSEDFIEVHLDIIEKSGVDITVSRTKKFYGNGVSPEMLKSNHTQEPDYKIITDRKKIMESYIRKSNPYDNIVMMVLWGKMYKRWVLEDLDWDECNYSRSEDLFMGMQIHTRVGSVCYIDKQLLFYRKDRDGSQSSSGSPTKDPRGELINKEEHVGRLVDYYRRKTIEANLDMEDSIVEFKRQLEGAWLNKFE